MTAGVGCKFTVHFSTSFSTTRTSFRKNGTLLPCRTSHSRLRHFLDDFGECRFGRLFLGFLFTHSPDDFTNPGRLQVNFDQRKSTFWRAIVTPGGCFQRESSIPMPFQAILREVDQLQSVSTRLEALAERNPPVSEPLTTIALSVRNTATLLEVLVAAKGPKPI